MPFTCKIGDTLRLSDKGGSHYYVILTEPNKDKAVVIVNFTSARYWKEWTTCFTGKDNKLFSRKTTVNYADARIVAADELISANHKFGYDYNYCNERIVRKIVIGAFQSQFTPIEVIEELSIQYQNEYKEYYEGEY